MSTGEDQPRDRELEPTPPPQEQGREGAEAPEEPAPEPTEAKPRLRIRRRGPHIVLDEEEEAEIERMLAEMADAALLEQAAQSGRQAQERPLSGKVRATVVSVGEEDVFVDLGERNQGVVPRAQFEVPPQVGTQLELIVDTFDPGEGLYLLHVPGAAELFDWNTVHAGTVLDVRITGHNSGGLEGEVSGIRAFIPASHVALERIDDLSPFVGQTLRCEVMEVRRAQRSLVLSRRQLLEKEREAAKKRLLAELAEGQVRKGRVRAVQPFGAFVDLGGVDGLVPISELSWSRVDRVEDVVQVGDEVEVEVVRVDRERERITLSLKRLVPSPWEQAVVKYPSGSLVSGKVTRLVDYGAFVELEPGLEGLVHISELAPHHVTRPSEVVKVGDEITVRILEIQPEHRRIRLSRREAIEELQRREEQEAIAEYRQRVGQEGNQQSKAKKQPKLKGGLDP